jgi:hypothetical protein
MMKPWQTPLNKALSKREKKEKKRRGTKFEPIEQNVKWVTKGHLNK